MDTQLAEKGLDIAPVTSSDPPLPAAPQGSFPPCLYSYQNLTSNHCCADIFKKLSILDRLLTPAILVCMVLGVVIGEFAPHVQKSFDTARFDSVSVRE